MRAARQGPPRGAERTWRSRPASRSLALRKLRIATAQQQAPLRARRLCAARLQHRPGRAKPRSASLPQGRPQRGERDERTEVGWVRLASTSPDSAVPQRGRWSGSTFLRKVAPSPVPRRCDDEKLWRTAQCDKDYLSFRRTAVTAGGGGGGGGGERRVPPLAAGYRGGAADPSPEPVMKAEGAKPRPVEAWGEAAAWPGVVASSRSGPR